ncbi:MAG: LptF/LptG family permease, partial [Flavobacteriales bacterium]|nr:LptF/LptG family permease [Flavobacteriales bacterium]
MKRLHHMIIRVYLGPLAITFLLVLFILSMQFLWKYVDDLMGKGLEWYVLAELLFYATASFVPLALPLGILLSSIMTLGGLGENSELTPMRSAGLNLFRILRPLIVLVVLLAAGSFVFSNNILPIANLRFKSLLWDVTQKKPTLNLVPNVFYNGIDGFSIRVRDKDPDTGRLTDVLIYDHRQAFQGNRTVVRAREGIMQRSTDGNYLLLTLRDGHLYDEHAPAGGAEADIPLLRGTFEEDIIRFDLSGLGLERTDEDLFRDHYQMLTMGQLTLARDSLERHSAERRAQEGQHMGNGLWVMRDSVAIRPAGTFEPFSSKLRGMTPPVRANLYEVAMNLVRNNVNFLDHTIRARRAREEHLNRFHVEWHRKPMLALTCIIFFFIGAPLGAIIRKGG